MIFILFSLLIIIMIFILFSLLLHNHDFYFIFSPTSYYNHDFYFIFSPSYYYHDLYFIFSPTSYYNHDPYFIFSPTSYYLIYRYPAPTFTFGVMVMIIVGFKISITTKIVSLNPAHGEVYLIILLVQLTDFLLPL